MRSKKKKKKFLYTIPVLIIVGFFAFVSTNAAVNAWKKMADSNEKREIAERELEELTERYEFLDNKLQYLDTEKGVEEAIRTKFNVARENEKVFIIVDDSSDSVEEEHDAGFWKNVKDFWKNIF